MADVLNEVFDKMAYKLTKRRSATAGQTATSLPEARQNQVRRHSTPVRPTIVDHHEKVRQWLSSADSGIFVSTSEPDVSREIILSSSSESEEDIFDGKVELPDLLQAIALDRQCLVEHVTWNISKCDMLLQLGQRLIPVCRSTLTENSEFFKDVLKESDDVVVIELEDQDEQLVREALQYINAKGYIITDYNVAELLHISQEFRIKELVKACLEHLRKSTTFNPMITLNLARRYNLPHLHDFACKTLSKIVNFEKTAEFATLSQPTQIKVMRYTIERYQRAWNTLNQFDVHLCSHHGDQPKENNCCLRSATYKQENGRTYLVRMEEPAKKITEAFKQAFRK